MNKNVRSVFIFRSQKESTKEKLGNTAVVRSIVPVLITTEQGMKTLEYVGQLLQ